MHACTQQLEKVNQELASLRRELGEAEMSKNRHEAASSSAQSEIESLGAALATARRERDKARKDLAATRDAGVASGKLVTKKRAEAASLGAEVDKLRRECARLTQVCRTLTDCSSPHTPHSTSPPTLPHCST